MRISPRSVNAFPRQRPRSSGAKGKKTKTVYKTPLPNRIGAALIDLIIGSIPGLFFAFVGLWQVGALILAAYLLLRDGMPIGALDNQSIGKKIVGLHVEIESTGKSLDPMTSVKRNLPLASGILLATVIGSFIPLLGFVIAAIPFIVELVQVSREPNGLRHGDRLAGTKVLD